MSKKLMVVKNAAAVALALGWSLVAVPASAAIQNVLIDFNELNNLGNDNGTAPDTNA